MRATVHTRAELRAFALLVGLCSLPFWIAGAVSGATVTSTLSIASLMVVAPFIAGVALTWRWVGARGVRSLLLRAIDPRLPRGAGWYLPVLLLMPAALVLEVAAIRFSGRMVPAFEVVPAAVLADLAVFWVAATLEEVGWTGFATDRLQAGRSALASAVVLGVGWALWHVPAMLDMPAGHSWSWIMLQCANLVAMRVLIVWVYNASGRSLFAAIAFHAVYNVCTITLFPVYGSHYDPLVAGIVLAAIAIAVIRVWTPATLSTLRGRTASPAAASGVGS